MSPADNIVECILCQQFKENKVTGPLSTKDDVTAHQNCLLYASGLFCRESPQFDDLFGFSAKDVMKEVQRGRKLICNKCKRKGATVGCEDKSCKKSYHYPCAIQAGARKFEDQDKGAFGVHCEKHTPSTSCRENDLELSSDSDSPRTSKQRPKRKLDFGDQQEVSKHLKRIISDDSTNSDDADGLSMFAPLESDLEENANSASDKVIRKSPVAASGSVFLDNSQDDQNKAENRDASVAQSGANSESLLLLLESTEVSIDYSDFWKDCNSAGCTQAIFNDFINEMIDIGTRITSEQASRQDCEVAFKVMMASGKLTELVVKQQKDLQKKLSELQQAAIALDKVARELQK